MPKSAPPTSIVADPPPRIVALTIEPPDRTSYMSPLLTVIPDCGGPLVTLIVGMGTAHFLRRDFPDYWPMGAGANDQTVTVRRRITFCNSGLRQVSGSAKMRASRNSALRASHYRT